MSLCISLWLTVVVLCSAARNWLSASNLAWGKELGHLGKSAGVEVTGRQVVGGNGKARQ